MAPTHSAIVRTLERSFTHPCPRRQQRLEHEESSVRQQVLEAKRRDARRWWEELAEFWRQRSRENHDEYPFHALRTDPLTRKILFPSHVTHVTLEDSRRSSLNVP